MHAIGRQVLFYLNPECKSKVCKVAETFAMILLILSKIKHKKKFRNEIRAVLTYLLVDDIQFF